MSKLSSVSSCTRDPMGLSPGAEINNQLRCDGIVQFCILDVFAPILLHVLIEKTVKTVSWKTDTCNRKADRRSSRCTPHATVRYGTWRHTKQLCCQHKGIKARSRSRIPVGKDQLVGSWNVALFLQRQGVVPNTTGWKTHTLMVYSASHERSIRHLCHL